VGFVIAKFVVDLFHKPFTMGTVVTTHLPRRKIMAYKYVEGDAIIIEIDLDESVDAVGLFNDISEMVAAAIKKHASSETVANFAICIQSKNDCEVYC
jgi:hypothetical protein